MIPFANAKLTQITAPGHAPDYDDPNGSAGTARWTGSVGVFVTGHRNDDFAQQIEQVQSEGQVDELLIARIEIPWKIGKQVQRGDSITYTLQGVVTTKVAEDIIRTPIVGRVRIRAVPG